MKKELRMALIKDWFMIDELLLGTTVNEAFGKDENKRKNYIASKSAMLENAAEIYKLCKKPPKVRMEDNNLRKRCKSEVPKIVKESMDIINSDKSLRKALKEEISSFSKEYNVTEDAASNYVSKKALASTSIDRYILDEAMSHITEETKNSFKFKTCMEAHNNLKENLLDISL